jgi:Fe-S-cluster containining protein
MPRVLDGQPEIYQRLLPRFFTEPIPAESKASCGDCPMCKATTPPAQRFRAETKCCTYYPKLPNYLVGALLADRDPAVAEGQRRVRAKIAARLGATPQWLRAPAKYSLLYDHSRDTFGRATALRCPYYAEDSGQCTIWQHRESVCATYHCRYVGGADGHTFWMGFKRYLSLCESQLSRYALLQLHPDFVLQHGAGPPPPPVVDAAELDEREGDELARVEEWGDWYEREEELYVRCYEIVRALNADDVARLLGLDGVVLRVSLERLRKAVVEPTLPARPQLNPHLTVRHAADGMVALGFHNEFDAIEIPAEAWRLLAEFRGEEGLSTVRERLRAVHRADLADEVLLELHRHRILI